MEFAPYRLSGVVYGTLLNHHSALEALGDALDKPPYGGAPKAPVLYLKPRNTFTSDGATIAIPRDAQVEVGATLGIVIGKPACRLTEADADEHIAGYVLINDLSMPHLPYYRPSVRFKARDGFCPIGTVVVPKSMLPNPDDLTLRVFVDGGLKHELHTRELIRPVKALLAAVTDFMTLQPGDVLTVGVAAPAPLVGVGVATCIEAPGMGRLRNTFAGEAA